MRGLMDGCKDIAYAENTVKIMSALNPASEASLTALADELASAYK